MSVYKKIVVVFWGIWCVSCSSSKDIVYLQDMKVDSRVKAEREFKTVIHVDDLLSIIVSCDDIEAALPFNTPMIGLGKETASASQQNLLGYLVDKDGHIDFPVLGRLQVNGISRNELAKILKEKLVSHLKNPIVTIQFQNFKVTILGEVRSPGSYKVNSERISIFDALGMAGDLQINAKRKNVLVIREDGKERVFARMDLTSSQLIHSPFFYLQQNDVVYVEPSRGRIVGGNAGSFLPYVLSSVSTFVAVLALLLR